ncbi:12845_t:CDS:2, partial [Acaulospora colombiana]
LPPEPWATPEENEMQSSGVWMLASQLHAYAIELNDKKQIRSFIASYSRRRVVRRDSTETDKVYLSKLTVFRIRFTLKSVKNLLSVKI